MKNYFLFIGLAICCSLQAQQAEQPSIQSKKSSISANRDLLKQIGKTKLTGRLVVPSDKDYEKERLGWDKFFSTYPIAIVYPQNADDVINAVTWAREMGMSFRVRSGGHSLEGWSSIDGGIVIDVSDLKNIKIDEKNQTATVGTGVNQGELWKALTGKNLGFPTGDEASVGLGGVILGGGIGVLSPSYGVACDNLLAVEMVVADKETGARLVKADLNNNSDLLWACRGGGGGNFGVATSYTVQLHDIPSKVIPWEIDWPFDALHDVFNAWQNWVANADSRLGSTLNISPPSNINGIAQGTHRRHQQGDIEPGKEVEVNGIFLGDNLAELKNLIAPITQIKGAVVTILPPQTFQEHYVATNAASEADTSPCWKFKASWNYIKMPKEALDIIAKYMRNPPCRDCAYWSLGWGGKVRKALDKVGGAYFHRDPIFYSEPGVGWDPKNNSTSACMGWASDFRLEMSPYVSGGYVNVPDRALADWGKEYYGTENFNRLQQIKRTWDPYNVFNFEQSIPRSLK